MTLTGDHRVSFDPDGGDYHPETQTVKGGDCAEAPRDPAKEGYVFEGWYYTEEDGNEVKWDFKTPVHGDIELKAKWKEADRTETTAAPTTAKKPKQKKTVSEWEYKKRVRRKRVSRTGDERQILCLILVFGAALTGLAAGIRKKRR